MHMYIMAQTPKLQTKLPWVYIRTGTYMLCVTQQRQNLRHPMTSRWQTCTVVWRKNKTKQKQQALAYTVIGRRGAGTAGRCTAFRHRARNLARTTSWRHHIRLGRRRHRVLFFLIVYTNDVTIAFNGFMLIANTHLFFGYTIRLWFCSNYTWIYTR